MESGHDGQLCESTRLLWDASRDGDAMQVKRLLEAHASPLKQVEGGSTALAVVALRDTIDVLRVMVEAGVDVNSADGEGSTPLMHAASVGRLENVRLLLAAGANSTSLRWYKQCACFEPGKAVEKGMFCTSCDKIKPGKSALDCVRKARQQKFPIGAVGSGRESEYDGCIALLEAQPAAVLPELPDGLVDCDGFSLQSDYCSCV